MDILWSLVFIHYITFKLKNLYFFSFCCFFVLIWCDCWFGQIVVGRADLSSLGGGGGGFGQIVVGRADLSSLGGGGGTLIFSYTCRLWPFFWGQIFEFQYFWGFSEKLIFYWV